MTARIARPGLRGICSVCERDRRVRLDGLMAEHSNPRGWSFGLCPGTGQPPTVSEGQTAMELEGTTPTPLTIAQSEPDPAGPCTVYASIGNSDDKLTQFAWAAFVGDFVKTMRTAATAIYGEWYSAPDAPFQNACIAALVAADKVDALRAELTELRERFDQESIAWAVATGTEFI